MSWGDDPGFSGWALSAIACIRTKGRQSEDNVSTQAEAATGTEWQQKPEGARKDSILEPPEGGGSCPLGDFRLPDSRSMREYISAVLQQVYSVTGAMENTCILWPAQCQLYIKMPIF